MSIDRVFLCEAGPCVHISTYRVGQTFLCDGGPVTVVFQAELGASQVTGAENIAPKTKL